MRNIIKCFGIYVFLIVFFVIALILSCLFSSKYIYDNVSESSEVLINEGNRKIVYIPYRKQKLQFDNYTDALMINTAYSIDSETPLYSALVARKNYLPNVTQTIEEDSAGELKSASKYKWHDEVGELRDLVNNDITESFEYARYWHGYLIILRPLLLLFNLSTLRVILTLVLFILFAVLFYLIARKINIIVGIIFFIGLISVEYFYLGFSLQGIFVFLIAIIFSIVILCTNEKIKNISVLFFAGGMLTNFFDFLTVPVVTLGLPLIVYLLLKNKNNKSNAKENVIEMLKISIAWGIGYGITWLTKWILVDVILGRDLIATAIGQVIYRTVGRSYDIFSVLYSNISYETYNLFLTILITVLSINIYFILNKEIKLNSNVSKTDIAEIILPYVLIGALPFIWYIVLKNHSINHAFFTYRNLVLTIISLNICIYKIFEYLTTKKGEKNEKE